MLGLPNEGSAFMHPADRLGPPLIRAAIRHLPPRGRGIELAHRRTARRGADGHASRSRAAPRVGPTGRIVAFEPNPRTYVEVAGTLTGMGSSPHHALPGGALQRASDISVEGIFVDMAFIHDRAGL
jgi:hypothetical protein